MKTIKDLRALGEPKRIRGDERYYDCPFCDDTKGHLGINLKKQVLHCFLCNASGRIEDLQLPTRLDLSSILPKKKRTIKKTLRLPQGTHSLSRNGLAYGYLKDRGITDKEIIKYDFGIATRGVFQERIIIPFYDKNKLIYYLGRTYTNLVPKYLNAPIPKRGILFKTFRDARVKYAVICEGVFDAIQLSKLLPAISLLGKVFDSTQLKKISKLVEHPIIMLDSDAFQESYNLCLSLGSYYARLPHNITLRRSDPSSLSLTYLRSVLPKEVLS